MFDMRAPVLKLHRVEKKMEEDRTVDSVENRIEEDRTEGILAFVLINR